MELFSLKFLSEIPSVWGEIYAILAKESFVPTLVGGSVRDYFLHKRLGNDWDIEVSHPTVNFDKVQWKALGESLSRLGKSTFLPYDIIRLEIGTYQFEFSPPRLETFFESQDHKNFTVEFNHKLPFEQAVLRRDFTINSMGVRFDSLKDVTFLDPLNGLLHLRKGVLHPAGPEFYRDPVRYLRAHRFALRLDLALSSELDRVLKEMRVGGVTPSYLWSEMQKSKKPIEYLQRLALDHKRHPELKLPVDVGIYLEKIDDLRTILQDPTQHEAWPVALEWLGIPGSSWAEYFSLSSETCRRLARWASSTKEFHSLLPEIFQGEFEVVRETKEFSMLFDWYFTTKQLMQKNPKLPLIKMIEEYLPAWIHLFKFEAPKDVKHIDPPFRAKYQVWNLCQRL